MNKLSILTAASAVSRIVVFGLAGLALATAPANAQPVSVTPQSIEGVWSQAATCKALLFFMGGGRFPSPVGEGTWTVDGTGRLTIKMGIGNRTRYLRVLKVEPNRIQLEKEGALYRCDTQKIRVATGQDIDRALRGYAWAFTRNNAENSTRISGATTRDCVSTITAKGKSHLIRWRQAKVEGESLLVADVELRSGSDQYSFGEADEGQDDEDFVNEAAELRFLAQAYSALCA